MSYWVLAADPRRFRVVDSIASEDSAWWRTGGNPLARGDRVAIWKFKGADENRGIVALGEVMSEPEVRAAASPFWVGDAEPLAEAAPRVLVRYVRNPNLPLWLRPEPGSVVSELSVARAQGGPAFHVAEAQWDRLMDELGGWTPRRDPEWSKDELILVLDLYARRRPAMPGADDPEVIELADMVNALPIHTVRPEVDQFRTPHGVTAKLNVFAALDNGEPVGESPSGGRVETEVWERYRSAIDEAGRLSRQLRDLAAYGGAPPSVEEDEEEVDEGRILFRMHRLLERDRSLRARKLQSAFDATGRLACEVCGFDFAERYGPELGGGVIDVHDRTALGDLIGRDKIGLKDLVAVCANCHRMLHRSKPPVAPEELRKRLT